MRSSICAVGSAVVLAMPGLLALYACGSNGGGNGNGDGGNGDDGSCVGFTCNNADGGPPHMFMDAGFTAPDCPSCKFPPMNAPPCANGTPTIHVVYPNDGVLVPPNMNVISVQWTPFGAPFAEFEVDFENAITDMRVVTKCAMQTTDTEQPSQPSGGCELLLDMNMWNFVAQQNRGGDAVAVTVRGTTDGMCANPSDNAINVAFANDDMLGAIYYWKSTVTANGVGGQIWVKSFGDPSPESLVTTSLNSTCNGCHALSRDGQRMVINVDDDDSDDEYADVQAGLIDMSTLQVIGGGANLGPTFASFYPDHTSFIGSNGLGPSNPPANVFYVYDGTSAAMTSMVTVSGTEPTMPDWSPDGKSVVFVVPQKGASWTNSHGQPLTDDDHIFGGSLFTMPYTGSSAFGAASVLLQSQNENNYYPGYSPDGQLIVFDRVAYDSSVSMIDGCSGTSPHVGCPNDSFSNPNARVMIMKPQAGSTVVDLERANGSTAAQPVPFSNSWPKWSPFLQKDHGDKLLWIAFSSTRDYGLRVRNHQPGMFQCYPADSYEDPGAAHHQPFSPQCQQPQLWMAAIDVSQAEVQPKDPSFPAFWLPFQDMTTHNHTPQWTQRVVTQDAGTPCVNQGADCRQAPCCSGLTCQANGVCGVLQ